MNYKDGTKIIYGERSLCAHLVQNYNEACHEEDADRLAMLCERFGIEIGYVDPSVVPVPETLEEIIEGINAACRRHIYMTLGWETEKQLSSALGVYSPVIAAACREAVDLTLAESDRCSALVREGKPYTPKWPVAADGALTYQEAKLL